MARTIAVGVDIGTYQIKVVVAEIEGERNHPHVIGMGFAESKGLRHGYIINTADAAKSIRQALDQAERTSKIKVKRVFVAIGGIGLSSVSSQATVATSRADSEISELDVEKVLEVAEQEIAGASIINRKVLHVVPTQYKVDGKVVLGRPIGMKGAKLEAKALFITCLTQHVSDVFQAVEEAGVEVEDVLASPIAASAVTLSKQQRMAGCVLANIGSETVSIVVFENNLPVSLEIFPIGSTDITNDIALGLKVSLEEAERMKLGNSLDDAFPRKRLEEIVYARLSDIFELIEAHLRKIGRSGLLPAGIIITGGGSGLTTIEDLAKAALKLPSRIGSVSFGAHLGDTIKDATWSVAYGLCIIGLTNADYTPAGTKLLHRTSTGIVEWLKQFLP
jgi:cell division protein FtsA